MRELFVFEHIPKTAGSTMHGVLWQLYRGKQVFLMTNPNRHRERIAVLEERLQEPDTRIKAIVAHTGFGFHERLPGTYQYRHFTFLRNPVDRVISHYHYQIQQKKLAPSTSLEAFVREDLSRSCNVQTAFLGGLEVQRLLDGITLTSELYTGALLEKAKAALAGFEAIGLTEHFDESLLLIAHVFGWPLMRLFYVRRRVGQRPTRPHYPEHVLKLIRQYNELDLELYHYGEALFEKQQAAWRPSPRLHVKTFQRLNRVFAHVYPLAYKARTWSKSD